MADEPKLTHRLLRTKEAAAYLSMSGWKLRRLIQDEVVDRYASSEKIPD